MRGKQRGQPSATLPLFFNVRKSGVFLMMAVLMHIRMGMNVRLRAVHHAVHQPQQLRK